MFGFIGKVLAYVAGNDKVAEVSSASKDKNNNKKIEIDFSRKSENNEIGDSYIKRGDYDVRTLLILIDSIFASKNIAVSEDEEKEILQKITGYKVEQLLKTQDKSLIEKTLYCIREAVKDSNDKVGAIKLANGYYNAVVLGGWKDINSYKQAPHLGVKAALGKYKIDCNDSNAVDLYMKRKFNLWHRALVTIGYYKDEILGNSEYQSASQAREEDKMRDLSNILNNETDQELKMKFSAATKHLSQDEKKLGKNYRVEFTELLFNSLDDEYKEILADMGSDLRYLDSVVGNDATASTNQGVTHLYVGKMTAKGFKDFEKNINAEATIIDAYKDHRVAKSALPKHLRDKLHTDPELQSYSVSVNARLAGATTGMWNNKNLTYEECLSFTEQNTSHSGANEVLKMVYEFVTAHPEAISMSAAEFTAAMDQATNGRYTQVVNNLKNSVRTAQASYSANSSKQQAYNNKVAAAHKKEQEFLKNNIKNGTSSEKTREKESRKAESNGRKRTSGNAERASGPQIDSVVSNPVTGIKLLKEQNKLETLSDNNKVGNMAKTTSKKMTVENIKSVESYEAAKELYSKEELMTFVLNNYEEADASAQIDAERQYMELSSNDQIELFKPGRLNSDGIHRALVISKGSTILAVSEMNFVNNADSAFVQDTAKQYKELHKIETEDSLVA